MYLAASGFISSFRLEPYEHWLGSNIKSYYLISTSKVFILILILAQDNLIISKFTCRVKEVKCLNLIIWDSNETPVFF